MWFVISALAAPPDTAWRSDWYARPLLNGRLISVNGRSSAQASVGGEVGLTYDHADLTGSGEHVVRGRPDLVGRSRLQGNLLYGLASSSTGFGLRLGSFIGPTSKAVTYQIGPDLWADQYGSPTATDYHLPFGMGIDVMSLAIFHIDPSVTAQVGIIPGWAFMRSRQTGGIGPFHQLTGFAMVTVRAGGFSVNVGYQRQYNAAGVFDGLILSGGL
ncbi:MAG: hypothetical protein KC656_01965 [Myxococcales bacterium]|nr:hypothetical protein [Myxococcales bacterium]MCB9691544.1 hypothetical protein [Alphaproteobacteria bacterium]